jgi:PBP1b-binding outer membrane lipoprotein LpoB
MKTKGILIILGVVVLFGCSSGDEAAVETYKAAPGQVTNPSAPPAQAGAPQNMQEAIQGNPNMPQAAKDAILRGKK